MVGIKKNNKKLGNGYSATNEWSQFCGTTYTASAPHPPPVDQEVPRQGPESRARYAFVTK